MGFFKKIQLKVNQKWYPISITVGKPVTTKEIGNEIAKRCTVSRTDTAAVLDAMGDVLSMFMANGRTVKLNGVGTFYYTATSKGNGVATADEVNASQINDVRVRFIPERSHKSNNQTDTRSMVTNNVEWIEWNGTIPTEPGDVEDPTV